MNVNTALVMGTYAQGMLDAAAVRNVLTTAAQQTLMNGILKIYEQQEGIKLPLQIPESDATVAGDSPQ